MIQCNRCNSQYIAETKRRLKDRFNEHRRTIDNPNTKSKPNHTANDMQLISIEKNLTETLFVRPAGGGGGGLF